MVMQNSIPWKCTVSELIISTAAFKIGVDTGLNISSQVDKWIEHASLDGHTVSIWIPQRPQRCMAQISHNLRFWRTNSVTIINRCFNRSTTPQFTAISSTKKLRLTRKFAVHWFYLSVLFILPASDSPNIECNGFICLSGKSLAAFTTAIEEHQWDTKTAAIEQLNLSHE